MANKKSKKSKKGKSRGFYAIHLHVLSIDLALRHPSAALSLCLCISVQLFYLTRVACCVAVGAVSGDSPNTSTAEWDW
ncbi:hypothetical protein B9Z55_023599 [Caenorhabditis nigoni]|uniref:Uncharacterized protein n=1 Tax=Caenorhabditis nigoni TaxID=1611254 RepID=A0A2G5SQL5_9PELO|nr:hypothetical protein B9Z55_023599 [Caenorhabditis nigoni]